MNINVNTWIIVNNQIRGHGVIIAFTWCTVISGFFVYSKKKKCYVLANIKYWMGHKTPDSKRTELH